MKGDIHDKGLYSGAMRGYRGAVKGDIQGLSIRPLKLYAGSTKALLRLY
jgi:hypothetical protein